jgi:hydroxymethylpyrimidine pyrophosphatase-like HAD family hydrolase
MNENFSRFPLTTENLAIISDLTGTLVRQTPDGFPIEKAEIIIKLLERGAFLGVITNDSFSAVTEHFTHRLDPIDQEYFVVSGGGQIGRKIIQGENEILFKLPGISNDLKRELLDGILGQLVTQFEGVSGLQFDQREALLSTEGARVRLSQLHPTFGPLSFIEIIDSKVAIFFLETPVAGTPQQQLMEAVQKDSTLSKLIELGGLYVTRGANYLDITSCTKRHGVENLLHSSHTDKYSLSSRNIIVLGDSINDDGILRYNYPTNGKVLRIYLGEDEEYASQLQREFSTEFLFLRGGYTQKSYDILGKFS